MLQGKPGYPGKFSGRRRGRFRFFQEEVFILYFAIRDIRTPWYSKLTAFLALVYFLSPIDLIPDFIPVAGYLDDLVIVPVLLHMAFRMLPADVKEEGVIHAQRHMAKVRLFFGLLLVAMGLVIIAGILFLRRLMGM